VSYPYERLHEEVAYLAKTLGWGHDDLMNMTHSERVRWVTQVHRLQNRRK
jgi:hypothetical protein